MKFGGQLEWLHLSVKKTTGEAQPMSGKHLLTEQQMGKPLDSSVEHFHSPHQPVLRPPCLSTCGVSGTELRVRTQKRTMAFALGSSWPSGTPRLTTKVGEHLFICPQPPQVGRDVAPLSTYRGTHRHLTANHGLFLGFHTALEDTPSSLVLEKEKGAPARSVETARASNCS